MSLSVSVNWFAMAKACVLPQSGMMPLQKALKF